ncbi:hypothetical protein Asp14428_23590 [Actinoplanes sp. NBRC 14428]|nr:hypothetical protein Asp14428_23590 [Actinoplanes sp. NBRC 14428]
MRSLPLAGALLLLLAGGCTSSSPDRNPQPGPSTVASPPTWTEPSDYTFVLERRCEGKSSLGTYRVTVTNRKVSAADRIDGRKIIGEEEIEVPTLAGLLQLADTAAEDGGRTSTRADPLDGHPLEVAFDVSETGDNADNTCFHITDYTPKT